MGDAEDDHTRVFSNPSPHPASEGLLTLLCQDPAFHNFNPKSYGRVGFALAKKVDKVGLGCGGASPSTHNPMLSYEPFNSKNTSHTVL